MKEKIMQKLFDGQELSQEELIYVGNHLAAPAAGGDSASVTSIPFDHSNPDVTRACGIKESDIISMAEQVRDFAEKQEGGTKNSENIQFLEALSNKSLTNRRALAYIAFRAMDRSSGSSEGRMRSITIDGDKMTGEDAEVMKALLSHILKRKLGGSDGK